MKHILYLSLNCFCIMALFPAEEIFAFFTLKHGILALFIIHVYVIVSGMVKGMTDKFEQWINE